MKANPPTNLSMGLNLPSSPFWKCQSFEGPYWQDIFWSSTWASNFPWAELLIWLKMCHNFVQFAFWQTIDCIVPEKLLCALWKANQNNPNKRGVEVCSCHCGQVGAGGGVGTKILACGAPRAFPGCHFLGQNYTPGQTGNPPGAVPQTSVVCSHNSLHVARFVCLSNPCLFVKPLFVCLSRPSLFVEPLYVCRIPICLFVEPPFACRAKCICQNRNLNRWVFCTLINCKIIFFF